MDKYVKSRKEDLSESILFFGNKNKSEREKWVAIEFLRYLKVDFEINEVKESNAEPIDVIFRNIGFQVKEVLDENRTRGKEHKDKLREISENTELGDLTEPYSHIHISLNDSLPWVASEVERHRTKKYGNDTSTL